MSQKRRIYINKKYKRDVYTSNERFELWGLTNVSKKMYAYQKRHTKET